MPRYFILDDHGDPQPCDSLTWTRWFEDHHAERVLAQDRLEDGLTVSTVFVGINMVFLDRGPPLIYETVIFGGEHDGYQNRYATRAEALDGHRDALRLAQHRTPADR